MVSEDKKHTGSSRKEGKVALDRAHDDVDIVVLKHLVQSQVTEVLLGMAVIRPILLVRRACAVACQQPLLVCIF